MVIVDVNGATDERMTSASKILRYVFSYYRLYDFFLTIVVSYNLKGTLNLVLPGG